MPSYSRIILGKLQQIRRRAFFVLVVNYASVGMFYSLLGLGVYGMLFTATPSLALVPLISIVVGLVLCAAILIAVVKLPSMHDTAALADRTLQLQQRLATALEFTQHQDDIALLLHKDASHHLREVDPARLWPFKLGVGPKALSVVALTLFGLAVVIRFMAYPGGGFSMAELLPWSRQQRVQEIAPRITHATADDAVRQQRKPSERAASIMARAERRESSPAGGRVSSPAARPRQALPAQNTTAEPSARVTRMVGEHTPVPPVHAAGSAAARAANAAPSVEASPTARQPNSPTAAGGAPEVDHGRRGSSTRQRNAGTDYSAHSRVTSQNREQRPGEEMDSTKSNSAAGHTPFARQRSADHNPAGVRGDGRNHAAAPSTSRAERRQAHTKGNGESHPSTLSGLAENSATVLATYRRVYQRYWNAAEAALAREQIPPGFRKYVREYFVAIHP